MGAFSQKKIFEYKPDELEKVVEELTAHFEKKNYNFQYVSLVSGGYDISITKSNLFRNILGMQSALKIKVQPDYNKTLVDISVGIWGQQLIPTVISMFVFWPVLITQIWGLIKNAKLDDEIMQVVEESLKRYCRESETVNANSVFCPKCGKGYPAGTKFCSQDGTPLT